MVYSRFRLSFICQVAFLGLKTTSKEFPKAFCSMSRRNETGLPETVDYDNGNDNEGEERLTSSGREQKADSGEQNSNRRLRR
jgi:hypothetical protein